jgi:putative ABC transport system ATP-binding protein
MEELVETAAEAMEEQAETATEAMEEMAEAVVMATQEERVAEVVAVFVEINGLERGVSKMEIIHLHEITKVYYRGAEELQILKKISLSISTGDFVAIIGPSGSGKSTLMNMIGLLDAPTSGNYTLDGVSTEKMSDNQLASLRNQKIGFIFQQFNLLPRLTAIENVELPMIYAGMGSKERREQALRILGLLGMAERGHHKPSELSGGQQQRVAIARALVLSPSLILADEPTGALDSKTGEEVLELIMKLNAEGNTIVLITHDQHIADHASRVVSLRDGEILSDIRNNPLRSDLLAGVSV